MFSFNDNLLRAAALAMLLAASHPVPAQDETPPTQDALRAAAESAQGTARVDALNELSKSYWGVSSERSHIRDRVVAA